MIVFFEDRVKTIIVFITLIYQIKTNSNLSNSENTTKYSKLTTLQESHLQVYNLTTNLTALINLSDKLITKSLNLGNISSNKLLSEYNKCNKHGTFIAILNFNICQCDPGYNGRYCQVEKNNIARMKFKYSNFYLS